MVHELRGTSCWRERKRSSIMDAWRKASINFERPAPPIDAEKQATMVVCFYRSTVGVIVYDCRQQVSERRTYHSVHGTTCIPLIRASR